MITKIKPGKKVWVLDLNCTSIDTGTLDEPIDVEDEDPASDNKELKPRDSVWITTKRDETGYDAINAEAEDVFYHRSEAIDAMADRVQKYINDYENRLRFLKDERSKRGRLSIKIPILPKQPSPKCRVTMS